MNFIYVVWKLTYIHIILLSTMYSPLWIVFLWSTINKSNIFINLFLFLIKETGTENQQFCKKKLRKIVAVVQYALFLVKRNFHSIQPNAYMRRPIRRVLVCTLAVLHGYMHLICMVTSRFWEVTKFCNKRDMLF